MLESAQRVIGSYLFNAYDQMVARLSNFKHIQGIIERQRQKNDLPKIPQDKTFAVVPTSLATTINDVVCVSHSL